jgi:predicted RNA binding protein YcfA (HicA-like mRNA interferase family)
VKKRLKADGFELRNVKGSHHTFRRPDGRSVTVPHPKKDLPAGTVNNIFKQAGWK